MIRTQETNTARLLNSYVYTAMCYYTRQDATTSDMMAFSLS